MTRHHAIIIACAVAALVSAGRTARVHADTGVTAAPTEPVAITAAAPATPAPRNALSLPLLSVESFAGVAVQYERDLVGKWSVAARAGVRDAADGDYGGFAVSAGAHVRWWIKRRAVWSAVRAPAMVGWMVSLGVDVSRTAISAQEDGGSRGLGSAWSVAPAAAIGYRFAPWRGLEITPSAGVAVVAETNPGSGLTAWTRGTVTAGVTVGWMY